MITSRSTAIAFALMPLGACGTFSFDHVFGHDGSHHGWHVQPARVGMVVVGVPMFVIASPIMVGEEACGIRSAIRDASNGVSIYVVGAPALAFGYLVALPPLLIGLPWESASQQDVGEEQEATSRQLAGAGLAARSGAVPARAVGAGPARR